MALSSRRRWPRIFGGPKICSPPTSVKARHNSRCCSEPTDWLGFPRPWSDMAHCLLAIAAIISDKPILTESSDGVHPTPRVEGRRVRGHGHYARIVLLDRSRDGLGAAGKTAVVPTVLDQKHPIWRLLRRRGAGQLQEIRNRSNLRLGRPER